MRRPDLKRLVDWAMRQQIPLTEKIVLVSMCAECDTPYLQVPFSQIRCSQQHHVGLKTVKRAVRSLEARGLIESRGRKPMDAHRYVNVWQLQLDELIDTYPQGSYPQEGDTQTPIVDKEGVTATPTSGGHTDPHSARGGQPDPQMGQNDPQLSTGGGHTDPPSKTIYITNSYTEDRGVTQTPTPDPVNGGHTDPHPALANLPPNANPGLARLIEIYPPIEGEQSFAQADGEYRERKREGHTESQMVEGIKRYRAFLEAKGTPPQYTMHLKKFIGPDKHFLKDWSVPKYPQGPRRQSKAERAAAAYRQQFGGRQ